MNLKRLKKNIKHISITSFLILMMLITNIPTGYINIFFSNLKNKTYSNTTQNDSGMVSLTNNELIPKAEASTYQNTPSSQNLINGTDNDITSATGGSAAGVNTGSWRGTLGDDSFHWTTTGTVSGIDAQLNVDGVTLNGANKIEIKTEVDLDAAVNLKVQICDWVSTTSVDNVADTQCTGGGWRTLNSKDASGNDIGLTLVSVPPPIRWHIYDGYFTNGSTGGTAISTPLSNFINTNLNNRVKIRYYSTVANTVIDIDYLQITAFIDSIYQPAGFTRNSTGGTVSGTYVNASAIGNSSTNQILGKDNIRITVPGTSTTGSEVSFYFSYKNIETYTGMNTILVRADYGCTGTGINITPKIYNFNTTLWETLSGSDIACSTNDTPNAWAKNNVTISNYISNGEIRVGWLQSQAHASTFPRIDYQYIMLGTTNTDSSKCYITIGIGNAADCANTRDLDTLVDGSVMSITAEDESTNMGRGEENSYYPFDTDADANAEEAAAADIVFNVALPTDAQVVGQNFAARYSGRNAGSTAIASIGLRDYAGLSTSSTYVPVGVASSSKVYTYTDSITATNASFYGQQTTPDILINTSLNEMRMRVRTSTDSPAIDNNVINWDFAMVSLQWIIPNNTSGTSSYQLTPSSQNLVVGDEQDITSATAASTGGTNLGSWRATLARDNFSWSLTGTSSGFDVQLNIDGVNLNGANKMEIQTDVDLDTDAAMLIQICDWVSSIDVDNQSDAQCTGGGWRTINTQNVSNSDIGLTTVNSPAAIRWHIYDGYFTTGSTGGTAISTPLSNFINKTSNNRVKIRYYSTNSSSPTVDIDYLQVKTFIDSIYQPAGFTRNSTGGTVSGTYVNASAIGNTGTAQVAGTDSNRIFVPSTSTTGSEVSFYFSYKNIETYTGMNTILVRANYGCTTTGINITPKIYNFNTTSWETLSGSDIACFAGEATNIWAKNNVTISNYISNGEIRVGWLQSAANATNSIRIDYQYIMLGTTNTDSSKCYITIGIGNAADCANTRDLDTLVDGSVMSITAEDESTNMGRGEENSYYPFDTDADANAEEAAAAEIVFNVALPTDAQVVGQNIAARYSGRTAGSTAIVSIGLRDYSGSNTGLALGFGSSAGVNSYTDSVVTANSTMYGNNINPEDFINTSLNEMRMRVATIVDSPAIDNNVINWDFAMVSLQWIKPMASISISGTANDSISQTVKVAINDFVSSEVGTISNNSWIISGVSPVMQGDIVTVWIDNVPDSFESTAITKYEGTGNITGMVLDKNVLSIGSNQNSSLSVSNFSQYSSSRDEDVMHSVSGGKLLIQGLKNNYINEKISILSGSGLTISGSSSESLYVDNLANSGAITLNGSPNIIISGTGNVFSNTGTFNAGSSIIKFTDTSSGTKTVIGGNVAFNVFWINGFGPGEYIISGNNSYDSLVVDSSPNTIKFTNGTTHTVNNWYVNGSGSNSLITLKSTIDGNPWNLLKNSGVINSYFVSIRDSLAIGAASFFAYNSTNVSGNTGWNFILQSYGGGGKTENNIVPDQSIGGGGQGGGSETENNITPDQSKGGGGQGGGNQGDLGFLYKKQIFAFILNVLSRFLFV